MNYYFIASGIFLFLVLIVHVVGGNKEYNIIRPLEGSENYGTNFQVWLMGRAGFQMISIDLLLSAIFTFCVGMKLIPFNIYLLLFILLLYVGYLISWLLTLVVTKAAPALYIRLGQWMLFLATAILVGLGIMSEL